ncbi:MAG TPA: ABC transporter ATP-binding protein [Acidimicrobiia bacterium]|jgi:putative ABC transport system ATP-binding protein|nr:ABC transporter ATP-binding protein [Acidimicrobiia bacterium]
MPLLEADRLFRFFHAGGEETVALAGVTFQVEAGELVAITGPSGSGKSTLLNCLAGLDEPDGGTVRIDGVPLSRRSEVERARMRARHVGVLWQNANLVDHLDVRDNVLFAQRLAGKADGARTDHLLERLGLADRAQAWPSTLSGGEAARAGLAVALANDPTVLLADEPTGELDTTTAGDVVALLGEHASTGHAVVVVTHADAVAEKAHRVVRLRDGEIEA